MRSLSSNETQFISGSTQSSCQSVQTVASEYKSWEVIAHNVADLIHDISLALIIQTYLKKHKNRLDNDNESRV